MQKQPRFSMIFLDLLVSLPLTCSGCRKNVQTPADTVVVGLAAAPATLDPRYATDATGSRIVSLMFQSLVKIGGDLTVVGDLAESWTFKELTYQFILRPDLKFANGRRVNPEDLKYSADQVMSAKSPFASSFANVRAVKTYWRESQLVFEIQLVKFSAKFLSADLPNLKILPREEILQNEDDFRRTLTGTGAFSLISQNENEIRLRRRPDLGGGRAGPPTEHLVFKIVHDDLTRYQKLIRGEIDWVQSELPLSKVAEIERDRSDQFAVLRTPGLSMTYLLPNLRHPLLGQLKVRQAIDRAIHRQDFTQFKLENSAREATSLLSPALPYFNRELKNAAFSLADAKAQVLALGLTGQKLTLKTSNTRSAVDVGRILAAQISQTGLSIQTQSLEWGTFYRDVRSGNFALATMRWIGAIDPDLYRTALHSREWPPGRNRGYYSNPKLDQLVDQGIEEANPSLRAGIYNEVQQLALQDLAVIPLWYEDNVSVISRRLQDFRPALTGDFSPIFSLRKEK